MSSLYEQFIILSDITELTEIEAIWDLLAAECDTSYFLSWGWVEAWLAEVPDQCKVYFIEMRHNDQPVLAFFVGDNVFKRSKMFKIKQLALNASGHSEYDNIWIEYNGFVSVASMELNLGKVLEKLPLSWDEISLPGLGLSTFPGNSLSSLSPPFRYIEDNSTVSPYVDLKKVRDADGDYLSLLSGNTRSQIRRSFRVLEKVGSVKLDIPEDLDSAFLIYREMVDLHQATWEVRGESGVFSSQLFCKFHERLIRNRFDKGEIQILRVHAGGNTIGCLYSFLWQGRIYFYQCGFNYSFGKKVQPGLVSHVMAVQYNAEQGQDVYDFLAGDARYKKSLATDYNKMAWGRIQRSSWKLKLEEKVRGLFERYRRE